MGYPWAYLKAFGAFKIDALGLVTLLGAEEINAALGRLVNSRYLDWLPLLGVFVVAGDRYREKAAGWNLYNITQGYHTTDLGAWLTRWVTSQDFHESHDYVIWTIGHKPRKELWRDRIIAFVVGFVFLGMIIIMTILAADWYGFANSIAMVLSVIIRVYVLHENRVAIDNQVSTIEQAAYEKSKAIFDANPQKWETENPKRAKINKRPLLGDCWREQQILIMIVTSNSRAVTMRLPGIAIRPPSPFIANLDPPHMMWYNTARALGWIAFAVHVICLGMACLATQLYSVPLIVIPTVLLCYKVGCADSRVAKQLKHILGAMTGQDAPADGCDAKEKILLSKHQPKRVCWIGSRIRGEIYEWPEKYELNGNSLARGEFGKRSRKRQHLYAWYQMSETEENSLDKWDLVPHSRDTDPWISDYKAQREAVRQMEEDEGRVENLPTFGLTKNGLYADPHDGLAAKNQPPSKEEPAETDNTNQTNVINGSPTVQANNDTNGNVVNPTRLPPIVPNTPTASGTTPRLSPTSLLQSPGRRSMEHQGPAAEDSAFPMMARNRHVSAMRDMTAN